MATDKQIEANRNNALKSTGPKTEEGKAKVAQNGSRYRKLAETVLLQSENPELFVVFARRFYLELQPKGPTERLLLNMMITAGWRLMRFSTMEAAGVDREYESLRNSNASDMTIPVRANMAYRNLCDNSRSLGVLNSIESRLQRQFDSAFDRLSRLLAARGKTAAKPIEQLVCN